MENLNLDFIKSAKPDKPYPGFPRFPPILIETGNAAAASLKEISAWPPDCPPSDGNWLFSLVEISDPGRGDDLLIIPAENSDKLF